MLLHTSSFSLSGLLWKSWGMAERQQTFARNHRDVCAGLTGTNITITLILECFGKQLCLQWCHILFDAHPRWCNFLYSAAARDGILHDLVPANPQGGKEVWCLEETQCYTTKKQKTLWSPNVLFQAPLHAITNYYQWKWSCIFLSLSDLIM